MGGRSKERSADQQHEQEVRQRSWDYAQQALADPVFREFLERSIERVNNSQAKPITKAEFLALTEIDSE